MSDLRLKWVVGLVALSMVTGRLAAGQEMTRAEAAQAYRAGGQPVSAAPDGTVFCEAEEFQVEKPGWQAKDWGENYYAATFANTFLSRKAFLGAPEQTEETVATVEITVPKAGRYLALIRYEAAYRFETQFRLRIEQGGKTLLDRLYGARDNVKIWAFKTGKDRSNLKKEVAWYWGAVENIVWEGHDTYVQLQPGRAKLSLVAGKQPEPAAKRNIDIVMLTQDEEHVKHQLQKAGRLPLDGMLTQTGDVFARVHNQADGSPMKIMFRNGQEHSPYWVHVRRWKPVTIEAQPGQSSDWADVGRLLDTLNDGQWAPRAQPTKKGAALHYKLEFGVRTAAGTIERIAEFESREPTLSLAYHADTRYSRKLRDSAHVLYDLVDFLKKQPVRGKVPQRTPIYCYTFGARPKDARHTAALKEFIDMYGLAVSPDGAVGRGRRGYIDVRSVPTPKLEEHCKKLGAQAPSIASVSLGDEIGLPAPQNADEGFRTWLKSQKIKPADVLPAAGDDWTKVKYDLSKEARGSSPGLYYWSARYRYHHGIQAIKERTDILRKNLPNAGIGANFSPHHGSSAHGYLGEVYKWVTLFRKEGMTMPWSEDYIWQLPMGSQQMNFINLDLFRAGLRHLPDAKIHYYVMPHWPGNTPNQWRRQFYGDLAHGMKIVNLFEFRPVQVAYTENHVTHYPMYLQVRTAFRELGPFEDIVQDGRVRLGFAGLWFSEASDIWGDVYGSFGPAKRALYIAIRHQELPLDFVVEEDALDGTLSQYRVLYLADAHVSGAASKEIAEWVKAGGQLFATAGAGMFDEFKQPNQILREVLGVNQTSLDVPEGKQVGFLKQDLPFTDAIAAATFDGPQGSMPLAVFGVRSRITAQGAKVIGTFKDKAPAATVNEHGKGKATYCAFLPSLTYFKPALPQKPCDRGSSDDAFSHFIPSEFDKAAAALIGMPAAGMVRPVSCSQPLVATSVIESKHGAVIPLVNWSAGPVTNLKVVVNVPVPIKNASLASGGKLTVAREGKATTFTLDLDVADALMLRPR